MKQEFDRAWVFYSKSSSSTYDDSISSYYSYDSNVPNHRRVQVGDLVIIREDNYLAGWSIVDSLEIFENQVKPALYCPNCGTRGPDERTKKLPKFRCRNRTCRFEFSDESVIRKFEPVTQTRANYGLNWHEAARRVSDSELSAAYLTGDLNSIRPLDVDAIPNILEKMTGRAIDFQVDIPPSILKLIAGGHSLGETRRRRGQREFRFALLDRYGERCAFTGTQPPQVLEAAHLYSYAKVGKHDVEAGLLLRRDCHTLFDAKLITIHPEKMEIEIAPTLERYESYRTLSGRSLQIQEGYAPSSKYLKEHYKESLATFDLLT